MLSACKRIRGSKKKETAVARRAAMIADPKTLPSKLSNTSINIFAEVFAENDDLIWPLQLVDSRDKEQFRVLYPLLGKMPHTVMYYLDELIFPEVLAYQSLKLSTCGQELGGDMLFGRRIVFSGMWGWYSDSLGDSGVLLVE